MNRIETEEIDVEQGVVRDLSKEQAQMVQTKPEQRDVAPFSVWDLGTKGRLSRKDIYGRI